MTVPANVTQIPDGSPRATPFYIVDASGNPITSGNPLSISLAVDAISATVTNDGTFAKETGGNLATLVTNTADLLADGDHLATIDTSTAPGVQGWIAATGTGTASQDDALTFAQQVRKVYLFNASATAIPFEFDQTAAATSVPLMPNQGLIVDNVLCTVIHVFPSATLPINTTSGLYVKGWK